MVMEVGKWRSVNHNSIFNFVRCSGSTFVGGPDPSTKRRDDARPPVGMTPHLPSFRANACESRKLAQCHSERVIRVEESVLTIVGRPDPSTKRRDDTIKPQKFELFK
jgi:hypothetical protein